MKLFKQFTYNDRLRLEVLVKAKHTPKEIAEILHFHISTIYRELNRGQFEALNSDLTKEMKMSTLNAKVFLIFSLSAICTINRAVLLCNFHIIQVLVLE